MNIQHVVQKVLNEQEVGFPMGATRLRLAVSGATMSPSIETKIDLMSKEKTLARIDKLLVFIANR